MKEDCSKININQKFRLCLFKSLIATVVCEKTKEPPAVLYTHKAVDCPQTAQCCFCLKIVCNCQTKLDKHG